MSELFDNLPELKSPRLLWMERHHIETHHAPHCDEIGAWSAWSYERDSQGKGCIPEDPEALGYGDTEHDAIADYARKRGWKLWNEEAAT